VHTYTQCKLIYLPHSHISNPPPLHSWLWQTCCCWSHPVDRTCRRICMLTSHKSAARVAMMMSTHPHHRLPNAHTRLSDGCGRTYFSWIHPWLKCCGLRQAGADTNCRRLLFQSTASRLTRWPGDVSTRCRHLYRRRPGNEVTRATYGNEVFRRTSSAMTDYPLGTASHSIDAGDDSCSVSAGLRLRQLIDLPVNLLRRLQSELNASAPLIFHLRRSEHIRHHSSVYIGCMFWSESSSRSRWLWWHMALHGTAPS